MTAPTTPSDAAGPTLRTPLSLWIAVALVGLQAVAIIAYAVSELIYGIFQPSGMAIAVAVFIGAYGGGLGYAAWALLRRRSTARAPLVLAQLLHLGIAWNARAEPLTAYALAAAGIAVVTTAAILWPSTNRVLDSAQEPAGD